MYILNCNRLQFRVTTRLPVYAGKGAAMKKKDLRHLNRRDLLKLLLDVQRENEALHQENETLRAEVEQKRIDISQLGSIAEASIKLNRVFEAAQAAADQYVANARALYTPEEDTQSNTEAADDTSSDGEDDHGQDE